MTSFLIQFGGENSKNGLKPLETETLNFCFNFQANWRKNQTIINVCTLVISYVYLCYVEPIFYNHILIS